MNIKDIKIQLVHTEKQYDLVKNQETFIIDSKSVEFLIESVKTLLKANEREITINDKLSDGINKIYEIIHSEKALENKLTEIEELYKL